MKKVFVLLVIIICSSCLYAHSGRTDKNGGHKVTKTGGYHYHGSPAYRSDSSKISSIRVVTTRAKSYQDPYGPYHSDGTVTAYSHRGFLLTKRHKPDPKIVAKAKARREQRIWERKEKKKAAEVVKKAEAEAKKAIERAKVLEKLRQSSIYIKGMAEYKKQKEQADMMFREVMNKIKAGR